MHDLPLHCPKDIGIFASAGWEPAVNITWARKTDDILKEYIIHLMNFLWDKEFSFIHLSTKINIWRL